MGKRKKKSFQKKLENEINRKKLRNKTEIK